jgi:phosphoribosylanthranilate isomerase
MINTMEQLKCKVCGMTDPQNVEEVSAYLPDYMGFIFYPRSLRYVGGQPDPALFSTVPGEVKKTAVFVNEYYERMIEISGKYAISILQLHGMESPETCHSLRLHGLTVIKVFPGDQVDNLKLLRDYDDAADFFLFDTPVRSLGGSGRKFDWSVLERFSPRKRYFLSGGIAADDADHLKGLSLKGLYAVDINSRFETAPGIKNPEMVGRFIKTLRNGKH